MASKSWIRSFFQCITASSPNVLTFSLLWTPVRGGCQVQCTALAGTWQSAKLPTLCAKEPAASGWDKAPILSDGSLGCKTCRPTLCKG